MPITYVIDREAAVICTTCYGPVSIGEVLDHFRTLGTDPLCPPELDVFLDLREMTSLPTYDQILEVSKAIAGLMSRMFSVFADDYFKAIRVFRSSDDGREWLEAHRSRRTP